MYGDSSVSDDEIPKMEDCKLTPTNPYAASKAACETMLNAYSISYGIPCITVRMNNVYGPMQWESKVIPRFIKEATRGE